MKKNSKDLFQEIDLLFQAPPSTNQKAWDLIQYFYHLVLTYMNDNDITQAKLALKMNKSRSAISQLFKQTPNISLKRMVEITDAIGITLKLDSPEVNVGKESQMAILDLHPRMWDTLNAVSCPEIKAVKNNKLTKCLSLDVKNKHNVLLTEYFGTKQYIEN